MAAPERVATSGKAVASLVLGILSLFLSFGTAVASLSWAFCRSSCPCSPRFQRSSLESWLCAVFAAATGDCVETGLAVGGIA